jgi:hypothetical protein
MKFTPIPSTPGFRLLVGTMAAGDEVIYTLPPGIRKEDVRGYLVTVEGTAEVHRSNSDAVEMRGPGHTTGKSAWVEPLAAHLTYKALSQYTCLCLSRLDNAAPAVTDHDLAQGDPITIPEGSFGLVAFGELDYDQKARAIVEPGTYVATADSLVLEVVR